MGALTFETPEALWGLALPLALAWLARQIGALPPRAAASGTLELWRAIARAPRAASLTAGRRVPPAARWAVGACALSCVGLAGPRWVSRRPAPPAAVRVCVDTSPSMYLPWIDPSGVAPPDASSATPTRLERALADLTARLPSRRPVVWTATIDGRALESSAPRLPADWRTPPRTAQPAPDWSRQDRAGCLWLTDAAPPAAPRSAAWIASGGAAVPGLAGVSGLDALRFDGRALHLEAGAAPRQRVLLDGALPAVLRALACAWAGARGLACDEATQVSEGDVALRIVARSAGQASPAPGTFSRDGWTVRASAFTLAGGDLADRTSGAGARAWPLEWTPDDDGDWPAASRGPWVTWRPGSVEVGLLQLDAPQGDAAAFAVSWSTLFDAARTAPAGCVEASERAAAGAPGASLEALDAGRLRTPQSMPWASGLFLAAALCAAAAAAAWAIAAGAARRLRSRRPLRSGA